MEKLLSSTAETEMSLDAFKLMAIVPSQQNTPHSREIMQKLPAPEWSGKLHLERSSRLHCKFQPRLLQ
jgi:hypothetical protein